MASQANRKGIIRKRRQHRAERRAATRSVREAHNARMRSLGHPGWTGPQHLLGDARRQYWQEQWLATQ